MRKIENNRIRKENEIVNYFNVLDTGAGSEEIIEIAEYFEKYNFSVFPYEFQWKYHRGKILVCFDANCQMGYVFHENKRMYFPKGWEQTQIRDYYNGLLVEQDRDSPHCYETDSFYVHDGDTVADIGAAEGIFGLTNIEKVKYLYLFECDANWTAALHKTFEPWKDKVKIINKYVSDNNEGQNITFDSFCGENRITFIKADIEGAEVSLLRGAENTMRTAEELKMVLCTYHKQNDADEIKGILTNNGFETEFSKRYMIFIDKELSEPYIRRGLIRAKKNTSGHCV
jgi:predicted RNA methylase